MHAEHIADHARPQHLELESTNLRNLWGQYAQAVASCVESATAAVEDEPQSMNWSQSGIDHLGLRRIDRQIHHGRASLWVLCYPGLRAALPKTQLQRRNMLGGDRTISDDQLLQQFTLTILGRGRGLRDRGRALVRELCEARCLTSGYFDRAGAAHIVPHRLSPAERSALTRNRLTPTQWRVLETLAFARKGGKLGLFGTGASWGRVFECSDRSVRSAMVGLERLGLAFRHYTPTEGTGGRVCDQAPNLIIPGPAWMRVDEIWTGDEERREELLNHWGGVARMRGADARRIAAFRKAVRVALREGHPPPSPIGGISLSFADWALERLDAASQLQATRDRISAASAVADDAVMADARRVSEGSSPIEVFEDSERREAARETARYRRADAVAWTTSEALELSFDDVEPLRGMTREELEMVGELAKVAHDAPPVDSNWVEEFATPPQAERNQGRRKGPAHADGPRTPNTPGPVPVSDLLWASDRDETRGPGDWGDGGDLRVPEPDTEPTRGVEVAISPRKMPRGAPRCPPLRNSHDFANMNAEPVVGESDTDIFFDDGEGDADRKNKQTGDVVSLLEGWLARHGSHRPKLRSRCERVRDGRPDGDRRELGDARGDPGSVGNDDDWRQYVGQLERHFVDDRPDGDERC